MRRSEDLARLPPIAWSEVGDGSELLLRPHRVSITKLGAPSLAVRVLVATLFGRRRALNQRVIEPIYKPLLWFVQDGVPVGLTALDIERLSELGRRWLESAGVGGADVIASIIPNGPHLDFWQLAVGARRAGVAAAFLEPAPAVEDVVRIAPTVLAGRPADLVALTDAVMTSPRNPLQGVRTVLVTGELPDDATRRLLEGRFSRDTAVVAAWAPNGVRAMWAECRGGEGFHTWPAAEIIELVDGEVVWSALGWAGSIVIRLRTGVRATLAEELCPTCKRTTARLLVAGVGGRTPAPVAPTDVFERVVAEEKALIVEEPPPPALEPAEAEWEPARARRQPFVSILDEHPGIGSWQGELSRRNGDEELVVFLAPARPGHPGRLIRELEAQLEEAFPPTQFVVLNAEAMAQRLAEHGNARVVDRR